ncbi:chitinase-3-like protein 1 [Bombyx mandarina]|uniref:GH18 domain-containing protein n=2 Tax=Bombyx TaxID=7090 RepID=A0A8R1WHE8_BOMMO|nr:chitinase-3-like protein 1 [Bombyx mori]XP_028027818.1 chitinase-3-like protein 1 [Bombyx mandarina]
MRLDYDGILTKASLFIVLGTAVYMSMLTLVYSGQLHSKSQDNVFFIPVTSDIKSNTVVSCYYNTPDNDGKQLLPASIDPHLCTHINVAFARVIDKKIHLDEYQYQTITELCKLKQENPALKVLISVGGAGEASGFRDMVANHASRKIFIKSIKTILRNYKLDGIDLDWEFPEVHKLYKMKGSRERQHFSQLLREIRMEYLREKRDYLLTVAVAAPEAIVDVSYDVQQINNYVDYVNIMTYDYHYYTKYTPFTGFNSPLFSRPSESLYMGTLNVNYTVNMYLNKGLDRDKIVVGIPTYGHSFTLVNADNPNIGSPASGYGSLGSLGFVNYPDVCLFVANSNVRVIFDDHAKVPYLYKQKEWTSFDSAHSVMEKAKYIKDNRLRGAMVYSLNADDYEGKCTSKTNNTILFPLVQSIRDTLITKSTQDVILV